MSSVRPMALAQAEEWMSRSSRAVQCTKTWTVEASTGEGLQGRTRAPPHAARCGGAAAGSGGSATLAVCRCAICSAGSRDNAPRTC